MRKRILALDYGKRRIGLAITDALGLTAQGLATLERTRIREDMRYLTQLARDREVSLFLFGDPIRLNGEAGRASEAVREFAARLESESGIPAAFWDERLTSVEANRILRDGGATLDQRKAAVDRMSAVLLLQSYMEAHPE